MNDSATSIDALVAQRLGINEVFLLDNSNKTVLLAIGTTEQGMEFLRRFANERNWFECQTEDQKRRRRIAWVLELLGIEKTFASQHSLWSNLDLYLFPTVWYKKESFSPAFWSDRRSSVKVMELLKTAKMFDRTSSLFSQVATG